MNNKISYRDILKDKYEVRSAKNKKYSMRAYAKDLGISISLLSEVLSEKKGLSPKKASEIATNLGLNPTESAYFCDLVTTADTKNEGQKILAEDR